MRAPQRSLSELNVKGALFVLLRPERPKTPAKIVWLNRANSILEFGSLTYPK